MDTELVKGYTERLLAKLGVSFESIEVIGGGPTTTFLIHTKDGTSLIGNRGETLQALNHLMKRLVEASGKDAADWKFLLDVNRYYESRLTALKREAEALADRARMFRHEVEMSPMNAYERMVIHALFANDPSISTASEGEGKFRHIVLRFEEPHHTAPSVGT